MSPARRAPRSNATTCSRRPSRRCSTPPPGSETVAPSGNRTRATTTTSIPPSSGTRRPGPVWDALPIERTPASSPTTRPRDASTSARSTRAVAWLVINGRRGRNRRLRQSDRRSRNRRRDGCFLGQKGGGGLFDTGYGYMIAGDRWNALPGALRVWPFDESPARGDGRLSRCVLRDRGGRSDHSLGTRSRAWPSRSSTLAPAARPRCRPTARTRSSASAWTTRATCWWSRRP